VPEQWNWMQGAGKQENDEIMYDFSDGKIFSFTLF
jgi:hypothetical protein